MCLDGGGEVYECFELAFCCGKGPKCPAIGAPFGCGGEVFFSCFASGEGVIAGGGADFADFIGHASELGQGVKRDVCFSLDQSVCVAVSVKYGGDGHGVCEWFCPSPLRGRGRFSA